MTVLNTIVAETLTKFKTEVDKLIDKGEKKEVAVVNVLREYVKVSKKIRFEGNGYSDEWVVEAKKRGLNNVANTPGSLDFMITKSAQEVFEKHAVLSHKELEARYEIFLEKYIKKIQIEGRVIGDIGINHVIPTAIAYQNKLITNVKGLKELGLDTEAKPVIETIKEISNLAGERRTRKILRPTKYTT